MKIESEVPVLSTDGFYVVNRFKNSIYWGAWRQWLRYELGKMFFPDNLSCLSPFPPETETSADAVAAHINKIRAMPDNKGKRKDVINPKMVVGNPTPWRRWTNEEMDEWEANERAEWTSPPKRTFEDVERLIRSVRQRYRVKRDYTADETQERPPLEYVPTPPELAAERAETLAARLHQPKSSFYDQLKGE